MTLPTTITDAIEDLISVPYYAKNGDDRQRSALETAIADAISAAYQEGSNDRAKEIHDNQKCNGWSNYATWRINLELIDDYAESLRQDMDAGYFDRYADVNDLADAFKEYAEEMVSGEVTGEAGNDLATSYADAFLSDVNWHEIAEAHAEELIATDDEAETDEDDTDR